MQRRIASRRRFLHLSQVRTLLKYPRQLSLTAFTSYSHKCLASIRVTLSNTSCTNTAGLPDHNIPVRLAFGCLPLSNITRSRDRHPFPISHPRNVFPPIDRYTYLPKCLPHISPLRQPTQYGHPHHNTGRFWTLDQKLRPLATTIYYLLTCDNPRGVFHMNKSAVRPPLSHFPFQKEKKKYCDPDSAFSHRRCTSTTKAAPSIR